MIRGGRRSVWAAALGALLAISAAAQTAAGPQLRLAVEPCVEVSAEALKPLVQLELGAVAGEADAAAAPSQVTAVALSCEGAEVRLVVRDPLSGKELSRHLELGKVAAAARERLLSLAVAELITASWMELALLPKARLRPVEQTASEEARQEALLLVRERVAKSVAPGSWRLSAFASGRTFPGWREQGLFGGGVSLERAVSAVVSWEVDLDAETGWAKAQLGTVQALGASGALSLAASARAGPAMLSVGAGSRLGVVRLIGHPADPVQARGGSVAGGWLGAFASARALLPLGQGAGPMLRLEGGWVVSPVLGQVSEQRPVGFEGLWLSVQLGVSLPF